MINQTTNFKKKTNLTFFLICIIFFSCEKKQIQYYPLNKINSYEYNVTIKIPRFNGDHFLTTMELKTLPKCKLEEMEVIPIKSTIQGTRSFQGKENYEFIGRNRKGFYKYVDQISDEQDIQILDYKNYYVKHSMKIGDTWCCNHDSYKSTTSVLSYETIIFPCGHFDNCIKIEEAGLRKIKKDDYLWSLYTTLHNKTAKLNFTSIRWYAPGIGLVKSYESEQIIGNWGIGTFYRWMRIDIQLELTSY